MMSLFTTIASDGPVPISTRSKTLWIIGAGIALAAAVAFLIADGTATEPAETASASVSGFSEAAFIEINTTALDRLVPPAAVVETPAGVDSFIYVNTTGLDFPPRAALAPEASDSFVEVNTTGLEYAPAPYTEAARGPR
jgi:hypothetical protein